MAVIRDIGYWIWSNEVGKWFGESGYVDALEEARVHSHADAARILAAGNAGIPVGRVMREYAIPVNAWNGR